MKSPSNLGYSHTPISFLFDYEEKVTDGNIRLVPSIKVYHMLQ